MMKRKKKKNKKRKKISTQGFAGKPMWKRNGERAWFEK